MCLTIKRKKQINKQMTKFIICELYKCTDKKLCSCETFESLGKTYAKIISKTIKGSRRKMIFKFIDAYAQSKGQILNNKNDKYVYLCKEIIGVIQLPKETYETVLTKYNELFNGRYKKLKRKIEIECTEIELNQKDVDAKIALIKSKKIGIMEDISVNERQLLQHYKENNVLRTKKDILAKTAFDLDKKFKTYCDIDNKSDVIRKNRTIAIQYSTRIFETDQLNSIFLPYEAYLEACENYLTNYDKQSANIKIYPFYELLRKELLRTHRLNNEHNEEQYKQKFKEITQWRDNLYVAIQENKKIEKISEFIVQKTYLVKWNVILNHLYVYENEETY